MPKAVESCPKCKKSPNLVTLIARWTNSYWLLWRHHENSPTFKRRSRHLSMEILKKMQEFDKTLKMFQKIKFYTSGTLFPLFKRQIDTMCGFEEVFLNGSLPVSFCYFRSFSNNIWQKNCRLQTQIVRVEGQQADHHNIPTLKDVCIAEN